MSTSSRRKPRSPSWLSAALGAAAVSLAGWALAQSVDPSISQRLVAGPPAGAAPMYLLDADRSGRAASALPDEPKLLWRARLQGGLAHAPIIASDGSIVAATQSGQLVQLGPDGKRRWALRLGDPPLVPPVVVSDGTRMVLVKDATLVAVDAQGRLRRRQRLPISPSTQAAPPLPLDDGGVALAVDSQVVRLEPTGALRGQAQAPEPVLALLSWQAQILVVTQGGQVLGWRLPGPPRKLGSFGGRLYESPTRVGQRLLGVVDHSELVEIDLVTGTRSERASEPLLLGPVALAPRNGVRVMTGSGVLLGFGRGGNETLRVPLDPGAGLPDAGAASGSLEPAPLVVDAQGRVGVALPAMPFIVVKADGSVRSAEGASCAVPVGVLPAGPKRMLVACASGLLWMLGQ